MQPTYSRGKDSKFLNTKACFIYFSVPIFTVSFHMMICWPRGTVCEMEQQANMARLFCAQELRHPCRLCQADGKQMASRWQGVRKYMARGSQVYRKSKCLLRLAKYLPYTCLTLAKVGARWAQCGFGAGSVSPLLANGSVRQLKR